MDEDLKQDIVARLYELHGITDNVLYNNYSVRTLNEELNSIEQLIEKVNAL